MPMLEEAIKELEFLFNPDRYISFKPYWDLVVKAARADTGCKENQHVFDLTNLPKKKPFVFLGDDEDEPLYDVFMDKEEV